MKKSARPTRKKPAKSVLVVDDDPTILRFVQKVLQKAGYAVTTAAEGKEGLRKLKSRNFDALLLDIRMPGMNGLELLARLRERDSKPRVVVMTGDDAPETVLGAVREQVYQYLNKPFLPKALLETVKQTLAAKPAVGTIEVVSARPDWVELLVPCDLDTAERIQSFLDQLKSGLSAEVRDAVGRAFRELLFNAMEWGGKLDPNRKVRISFLRAKRMLLYRIADPGTGFKLEDLPHAAISNPPDKPFNHVRVREEMGLRAGGFGILMARSIVDELLYNEARNEVVFVKYLD